MTFGENLNCKFRIVQYTVGNYYSCEVISLDNTNNNMVITGHNGVHQSNKNDKDVKGIYIHDTNAKFIPDNLGHLFNLTVFHTGFIQLVEINAQKFIGMSDIEYLYLHGHKLSAIPLNAFTKLTKLKLIDLNKNQIEELPNGIFSNNLNLEQISLYQNKLKFLGSTLFDGLTKLNYVRLKENICINTDYSGLTSIIQLKYDINMKCNLPNDMILYEVEKIHVEISELKTQQQEIFKTNQQHEEMSKIMKKLMKAIEKEQTERVEMEKEQKLSEAKTHQQNKLQEINSNLIIELNKAKRNFINLQDDFNDFILKSLDENFTEEMKFIALKRQFDLAKEQLSICAIK